MKQHLAALMLLVVPTGAAAQTKVHIESDHEETRLERAVPHYDARGRLRNYWTAVCEAPCDQVVWSGLEYRIAGPGMRSSAPFTVTGPATKLHVAGGSTGSFIAGFVVLGAGAGLVVGTAMWSAFDTFMTGHETEKRTMYILIGTGAALAVVGGVLLATSSTSVTSSGRIVGSLRLTPRGIEF